MKEVSILDCTLRDGGYINEWNFSHNEIDSIIRNLTNARLDYIEIGYLTSILGSVNGSRFQSVEAASAFIPEDRKHTNYLIMADVSQFDTDTLCPRSHNTLDGIRVVFYKRQIEQAIAFCKKIVEKGYDLFLQPMVTVDYSQEEYAKLIRFFFDLYHPAGISIVDSFGSLNDHKISKFISILDDCTSNDVIIGFHGHDNLHLAMSNAIHMIHSKCNHNIIIDTSVSGIGRGAGNLYTELFIDYLNMTHSYDYNSDYILNITNEAIEPIAKKATWGYSPYFRLTALRGAHPNFATYLLDRHPMSVNEFKMFLDSIPDDMLSQCTKVYVEDLYTKFLQR